MEIDPEMTKMTQEIFPDYFISCADVIVFLKQTDKKYDYIFSAHVFEHFSIDDGIILADLIYSHLKDGGKWINIMPNASNFMAGYGRYNDITHKVLYTENSFTQSLTYAGFSKEKIEHRNAKFQRRWWVVYVQKLVSRIFSYVCILLDIPLQRIYTFEIYSIITK